MYNSTYAFSTYRGDGVPTKRKRMKKTRIKKDERQKTEWLLCSDDWRDTVIMYVTQINDIAIKVNYSNIVM